jgi:hypothetical protein
MSAPYDLLIQILIRPIGRLSFAIDQEDVAPPTQSLPIDLPVRRAH